MVTTITTNQMKNNRHDRHLSAKEVEEALRACRRPGTNRITIFFEDGTRQVINPTGAFRGDSKGMAATIAAGRTHKVVSW